MTVLRSIAPLPRWGRPAGRRSRRVLVLVDALVYIAAVALSDALLVWALGPSDLGTLLQSLGFYGFTALLFVATLLLLGMYDRPAAATVRAEIARARLPVTAATICAFGATLLAADDLRIAAPALLALPLVLVGGAALRLRLGWQAAMPVPAALPAPAGASDLQSTDLTRLAQALAHQVVSACGVQGVRIFTRSSDGGALVLRGAALLDQHGGVASGEPQRLRIPLTAVPWLERLLADGEWLHVEHEGASPESPTSMIAPLLCDPAQPNLVSLAALRVADGPVGVVMVVHAAADAPDTREHTLRRVAALLAERQGAIEHALRLRALGSGSHPSLHVIRALPYGAAVVNLAGRVLAVNPAAEASLGRPAREIVGRRLCAAGSECPCPLHTALRLGSTVRATCAAVFGADGAAREPMTATVWPIRGATGEINLIMVTFAVETAVGEQPSAPPMGAEVAAMMSHELRAPLATLRMASELALEEDIDPEDRQDLLARISQQVTRLDGLLQELADVFRLQAGQLELRPQSVDLPALCQEIIDDLEHSGHEHHITLVHRGEVPRVTADRLKIRTVLSNIIGNAVKYTPAGSTVTVSVDTALDGVCVAVQDEGAGIEAEHLPHIFDQFYRAGSGEGRPKGYGLGLYIARTMVGLHGGRIWAESEPGRGSRFCFVLPLRRDTVPAATHPSPTLDSAHREHHAAAQWPLRA